MEAGLADKQNAAIFEPGEHLQCQLADFFVVQIHKEPVGKDDVVFGGRQLQRGHIGADEVDVRRVVVGTIALHILFNEVDGGQMFTALGQILGKSAVSTKIPN